MATMPIFVFTNSGISSQGMMLPYGIFLVDAVTPLDVETLGFHQTSDGRLQTVTVRTIEDVSKLPALSSVPDKLDMWPVSFGDMRSTERHTIGCYPAPPPPGVFPIGFLTQVVTGATSIMMVGISKANMSTAFLAPAASAPNPASVPAVAPAPAVAAASGGVAVVPPVASMSKKGQSMLSGARFPTVIAVGDDRADTLIRPHTVRNPRAVPELLAEFVSHELPGEYEFTRAKGKLTIVRVTQVEGGAVHKVNITGPKQLYFDSCALLNEHGNGDKEFFKCMDGRRVRTTTIPRARSSARTRMCRRTGVGRQTRP